MLYPKLHDWYSSKPVQRSLELKSVEFEVFQKKGTCSIDMWIRLIQWITIMFSTRRTGMDAITRVWNDVFAGHFDRELEYDSLARYLDEHPNMDHRAFAEYIMYNAMDAGPRIRLMRNIGSRICQLPGHRKRDLVALEETVVLNYDAEKNASFYHRTIDPWGMFLPPTVPPLIRFASLPRRY
jgi:hypothetical protein